VEVFALGGVGLVEFMVAGADEVDVLLFGDLVREFSPGL
jgi:hypothetical protein